MLTKIFDAASERGFAKTPAGMAFWTGTGPEGKTCGDCGYFHGTSKGRCRKYRELAGRNGLRFRRSSAACKYFEPSLGS